MNSSRCSRFLLLAHLLLVAFSCGLAADAAQKVVVTADRVNLRAKPVMTAEVVTQVSSSDVLVLRSLDDAEEWVEVAPPAHADMWVHHKLVQGSEVLVPNVNVRAGPGENHAILGKLSPGDVIQQRGELGDWIKIAPPTSASLWVSASLVKLPEPPPPPPPAAPRQEALAQAPKAPEVSAEIPEPVVSEAEAAQPPMAAGLATVTLTLPLPASTPEPPLTAGAGPFMVTTLVVDATSAPDASAQSISIPEGYSLLPVAGQGLAKSREGRLRLVGYIFRSPTRYRLVTEQGETICYLDGNQSQLRTLLGRRMRIMGREFWVKGKDQPLLTVERIILLSELEF